MRKMEKKYGQILTSPPCQHVGSYQELRDRAARVEEEVGWEGKKNKLFWRGSMRVGTADREALMGSSQGYEWNDVLGINWGCE